MALTRLLNKSSGSPLYTVNTKFSIKEGDISEDGTFTGIASPFWGTPDSHGDIIVSGAYADTIKEGGRNGTGIAMLYQHKHDSPIGIWTEMVEKDDGLYVTGQLNLETQLGRETYALLKQGALKGLSIGFELPKNKDGSVDRESYDVVLDKETGNYVTYYKKLVLWEISIVTFPAATEAQITTVKDFKEYRTERDWENGLRDSGLSKSQAQYVVSLIKPSLRDSETQEAGEEDVLADVLKGLRNRNVKEADQEKSSISGSTRLPLDEKSDWSGDNARKRMLARAGGKDNFDPEMYGQGFVVLDGDKENLTSYKLPFADVIDGELKATWGGVINAMRAVLGARGGVDITNRRQAYDFLAGYYKRFDQEAPSYDSAKSADIEENDELIELLNALKQKNTGA